MVSSSPRQEVLDEAGDTPNETGPLEHIRAEHTGELWQQGSWYLLQHHLLVRSTDPSQHLPSFTKPEKPHSHHTNCLDREKLLQAG